MELSRSIVVDYLERYFEREDIAIAYIYCNYKEQGNQTSDNLIASLLQQLVRSEPTIPDNIASLYYDQTKKQRRPTLSEWSKLLQSEVHRFSKVFIIIDALDECTESSGSRASFLTEIRKLQPSIHLLVTSRHILTVEHEFKEAAYLEIRASDEDVRRYVKDRIEQDRRLQTNISADPSLRETVIDSIVKKANGM